MADTMRSAAEELKELFAEASFNSEVTYTIDPPAVTFEKINEDAILPVRGSEHSAGMDAFSYLKDRDITIYDAFGHKVTRFSVSRFEIQPGWRAIVPLGFKATLPAGYEAQVRARSSWALKKGLIVPNSPGTIDADYPGEWGVLLANIGSRPQIIHHSDRVAQIVLNRYENFEWVEGEVGVTTDRTGGFGSTG